MELWVGCVAGALEEQEFLQLLTDVGFEQPNIEPTRVYRAEDARAFLADAGLDASGADGIDGKFMAAFVRATKPASTAPALRAATMSDLAAVERLLTSAGLPDAGIADLFATRAGDFLVAEAPASGELLAVGGLEVCCDDALLRSVAVREDARQLGLGRALVLRLIAEAERRGLRALYLLTQTAEHYFPRFGFAPIDRGEVPTAVAATEEFTSACPASAMVMRRMLASEGVA
jgi:amino-acid N-acetyltransferase